MPIFARCNYACLSAAFALCITLAQTAQADTLLDIYELALSNDPTLQSAEATYLAGDTIRQQALAVLLPEVKAAYSHSKADTNESTLRNFGSTNSFGGAAQTDTEREDYSVTLTQNVFNLSALFGYKQSKAVARQSLLQYSVAQQALIVRVAEAYFNALRGADNLSSSRAEEKAIAQQLEQTQQRYEVGLIAITDVHEAQAAYDLAIANRLTEEVNVGIAYEALAAITGQQHRNLYVLSLDFPIEKPTPTNETAWVEYATQNNLSIKLAEQLLEAANQNRNVKIYDAAPTVQAVARYLKNDSDIDEYDKIEEIERNPSFSRAEGTSVELRVELPLFSGGARSAERRQASYERVAEQANLVATKRRIFQDTRSSYLTTVTDTARVQARQRAIISATSALEATEAGYDAGTRNIVDLLNAQRDLYRAQRDFANIRYDYVLNSLRLKEAAGTINVKDISGINEWLRAPDGVSLSDQPSS